MNIKEVTLTTSSFNVAEVLEGNKAIGNLLVRLLLLVPGKNPLHPAMGVGIGTLYRFISSDQLSSLRLTIEKQIETYLPSFQSVNINLEIDDNKYLIIKITIDSTVYIYNTYNNNTPVELSVS